VAFTHYPLENPLCPDKNTNTRSTKAKLKLQFTAANMVE
jgi:hypothetical protein